MKNYAFLFWAYNIVWLGISGYLVFLFLRLRSLDRRLQGIERELPDAGQERD